MGISPWEFAAIAVIALLIFGPDKLPKLAADAGRLLREIRRLATGAKRDLQDSIGPELGDLNLSDLNPATFVKKNLLDPVDEEVKGVKRAVNDPDGRRGPEGAAAGAADPSDGDGADPPPPRIDADTI